MPLKKPAAKGPAPVMKKSEFPWRSEEGVDCPDLVDEAIHYFRPNVLFKKFTINGPADRVLVYCILFISLCLHRIAKCSTAAEALKELEGLKGSKFAVAGEPGWVLGSMFPKPDAASAGDTRRYLKQLRETIIKRIVPVMFLDDETPNKFWMAFAKKSFMNINLTA